VRFAFNLLPLCLATAALLSGPACAQGVPSMAAPRAWSSLRPAQQTALQPLQDSWSEIDAVHKRKWVEVADKFVSFSPADQARIQGRMAHWAQLSPSERGATRLNYLEAQRIQAAERSTKWEAYQALSPEQREQFMSKSNPGVVSGSTPFRINATTSSGATTNLMKSRSTGVSAQPTEAPKILTNATLLDRMTLLPKIKSEVKAPEASASGPGPASPR
jgi:Protein of unknown function (DUF3106)